MNKVEQMHQYLVYFVSYVKRPLSSHDSRLHGWRHFCVWNVTCSVSNDAPANGAKMNNDKETAHTTTVKP